MKTVDVVFSIINLLLYLIIHLFYCKNMYEFLSYS